MKVAPPHLATLCVVVCLLFSGESLAQAATSDAGAKSKHSIKYTPPPELGSILAETDEAKKMAGMANAIEYYQQLLADQPDNISTLHKLGKLYTWTGKTDLAIVTYQSAIRLDNNLVPLKNDLARIYRWSRRFTEAEELYKEVLDLHPENLEALKGLASTYLKMGDYGNARTLMDRALALYPNDAELYKDLGVLHAWQRQYPEAIKALEQAIGLSPDMIDGYITLGDVYYWNGRYENALNSYKRALVLNPNSFETHVMIAKVYRKLQNLTLAKDHARTALSINQVDSDAKELLAQINSEQQAFRLEYGVHYLEFFAQAFFIALIFLNYKKHRKILHRRKRLIANLILVALPAILVISIAAFVVEGELRKWMDIEVLESFVNSILVILLGLIYLSQIRYVDRAESKMERNVILAIGAHPDDIELGCGGYLIKAKENGAKVYGLTLTKGERGGDNDNRREKEASSSAEFMDLDGNWIFDFPDTHLQDNINKLKNSIESVIKEVAPTTVLTHNPYDTHGDHRAVFSASREAARMIPAVLCYESVSTPDDFKPDYYVDITDYLKDMLKAVRFHKTQSQKTYMDPELLKGRAAHRGIQCGVPYASAFKVYRILD